MLGNLILSATSKGRWVEITDTATMVDEAKKEVPSFRDIAKNES